MNRTPRGYWTPNIRVGWGFVLPLTVSGSMQGQGKLDRTMPRLTGADEIATESLAEVMEDPVAVLLYHLRLTGADEIATETMAEVPVTMLLHHLRLTGADEVATESLAEVVEDPVAMLLHHLGVDVETRVAELRNLLREQLHSLGRVAEYDRLVDL